MRSRIDELVCWPMFREQNRAHEFNIPYPEPRAICWNCGAELHGRATFDVLQCSDCGVEWLILRRNIVLDLYKAIIIIVMGEKGERDDCFTARFGAPAE